MIPPSALIQYSALVLTLTVCIYLFVTIKRDVRVQETRALRRSENLRTRLDDLAGELEALRGALEGLEQRSDPSATIGRTLGSGVRIQALRKIKQGDAAEQIAAELGLPRNEVELLIKVQKLVADNIPRPTS